MLSHPIWGESVFNETQDVYIWWCSWSWLVTFSENMGATVNYDNDMNTIQWWYDHDNMLVTLRHMMYWSYSLSSRLVTFSEDFLSQVGRQLLCYDNYMNMIQWWYDHDDMLVTFSEDFLSQAGGQLGRKRLMDECTGSLQPAWWYDNVMTMTSWWNGDDIMMVWWWSGNDIMIIWEWYDNVMMVIIPGICHLFYATAFLGLITVPKLI